MFVPNLIPSIRKLFYQRVYAGIPNTAARVGIFRKNLENVSHSITSEELYQFAEATENYSASDIICIVRDAIMEPIRKITKAEKFKLTPDGKYIPTTADDPSGLSYTYKSLPDPNKIAIPAVTAVLEVLSIGKYI